MSKPWIDIIGIGEDGWDGLSTDAQQKLREAEIIIGGDRHHKLASGVDGSSAISGPVPEKMNAANNQRQSTRAPVVACAAPRNQQRGARSS